MDYNEGMTIDDDVAADAGTDEDGEVQMNNKDAEDWEAELDDGVQGTTAALKDWKTLQAQIKAHMKKNSKTLPLSHLNQHMILSNFTTC